MGMSCLTNNITSLTIHLSDYEQMATRETKDLMERQTEIQCSKYGRETVHLNLFSYTACLRKNVRTLFGNILFILQV
jgi:hypothetical protein